MWGTGPGSLLEVFSDDYRICLLLSLGVQSLRGGRGQEN